jgi:hypothetical protein
VSQEEHRYGFAVSPEPSPAEREALVRALAQLRPDGSDGGRGAWWREGIREALEPEPER